ncbi:MAG: stage II sporulation protein P, partial [Bacillota bacterium]
DRENAERGAMLFADGLPAVLGITGQKSVGQSAKTSVGMGDNKSIWWIIGLVVVAVLAFLLLSTGSIKGSISKLKQFSSKEWSNYLGASKQGAEEKEDIKSKKTRQD